MKYMNYESNLKKLREINNLTQEELAEILNINRTTYNHYENNYVTIPIKHLIKISEYFKISINYLLGFTNDLDKSTITNKTNLNIFKERLKEFRKTENLKQENLAQILNTTQGVIANYERGRNYIATPFLFDLCKKYNYSADYLLGLTDKPKYIKIKEN